MNLFIAASLIASAAVPCMGVVDMLLLSKTAHGKVAAVGYPVIQRLRPMGVCKNNYFPCSLWSAIHGNLVMLLILSFFMVVDNFAFAPAPGVQGYRQQAECALY